ncbi:MAG: lytic transglycosylase domain-containing protein [Parvibaculum sp.]|nr:lytic transglycosylase domain-containing protein [Parvibaculum sp.]
MPLDQFQAHIKEAAQRFAIPEDWIRAVIIAESNGDPGAVSPRGAMGLMQLMPGTWDELREQHGLGTDAFDPHTNILAGTAYLKAMYERFGSPGLFAAYNAGPGRYAEHLRTGKPLPAETRAYVAGIEKALADAPETVVTNAKPSPSPAPNSQQIAFDTRLFFPISTSENSENSARNGELFVPLSTQKQNEK